MIKSPWATLVANQNYVPCSYNASESVKPISGKVFPVEKTSPSVNVPASGCTYSSGCRIERIRITKLNNNKNVYEMFIIIAQVRVTTK